LKGLAGFFVLLCLAAALPLVYAQGIEDTPLPPDATQAPIITPTPVPRPQPVQVIEQDGIRVELFFNNLPQGQMGLVHVYSSGLAGARARLFNEMIEFFPIAGDGFYGLLSAGMEQNARSYDMTLFAWYEDGRRVDLIIPIAVVVGQFIRQEITMAPDRAYLVDAEIERGELARLESIFNQRTGERLWDDTGFQMPILNSQLTSPFGAFRTFNGILQTRHTGWDIRTTLGVPVMASSAGVVAYTGRLEIRGNLVVIDHGLGIYSTYSHLSQIHVTRGQSVVKGQIIGVTGDTGRSSGPHFHWEVAVNGNFVDSVQFAQSWLP
jgi:murein DD-endopeptidase MepM/ murein hydrolase activator NlpD